MRALSHDQVRALKDLRSAWPGHQIVLIGASALQCFLDMRSRQTRDIDLSISIALEEYPGPLAGRPGWSPRANGPHKWDFEHVVELDILPAGPRLLAAGKISWPGGSEMNLTGFRLAFEHSVGVEIAPGLSIDVAPVAVIVLLKMVAYLDRPFERTRDLVDIALILDEWPPDEDDARFGDAVRRLGLTHEQIGPYLLGQHLGRIANAGEQSLIRAFLEKAANEDDRHQTQTRFISVGPAHWGREPAELIQRVDALRRGIADASAP